jgi:hydrogenase nickel incorporation protein HypA/HybF
MHELSVTQSLLEIAVRHAQSAGAQRVTDLYLVIGQLSSIIDDSVSFYWDMVSQGTPAEGARLHFRRIPTQMRCQDCGASYAPSETELACPECRSLAVRVIAGEEFMLEAIDVETEPAQPSGVARG